MQQAKCVPQKEESFLFYIFININEF